MPSYQFTLQDDLTLLRETLEDVLRVSDDPSDKKYLEAKARAENVLKEVQSRISEASDNCYVHAKQAVCQANGYVHKKPWQSIGAAAAVGVVLGFLISR